MTALAARDPRADDTMSTSPSTQTRRVPRAVLARVITREILEVDGVVSMCPRFFQRFGRAPGVTIRRRGGSIVSVRVLVSVVHDAGAVHVARRVQDAVRDAVMRISGELPARVIVVVARFKLIRSPQKRGKGEMR